MTLPDPLTLFVGVRDDEVQASLSELADFYRPHNAELERFLERPMGWDR